VEIFRPSGTIGHANILGAFLAMSLPIAISQVLLQPGLRRKLLPFLALCVGTTALVMSFSRGAWISFSAAATWVLLVAVVIGKLRGKHLLGVVISVAAVAFMVVTFSSLVESRIFDPDPGSAKDRMRLNELAWNMIQDHPLLGVGVNTFGKVMSEYDFTHFGPQNVVHNVYLLMTAESGVFALLAYLWLILAIGRQAVKAMGSKNLNLCMTATAILGGFVGLWFQMLVEILVTGPPVQVFWFFVGIIGGINGMQQRDLARASAPRRGRVRSPGRRGGDGGDEEGMAPREILDDPWDRGLSRDGASR
jgi:putative inorganic carbon (HCO3(-)) transporter